MLRPPTTTNDPLAASPGAGQCHGVCAGREPQPVGHVVCRKPQRFGHIGFLRWTRSPGASDTARPAIGSSRIAAPSWPVHETTPSPASLHWRSHHRSGRVIAKRSSSRRMPAGEWRSGECLSKVAAIARQATLNLLCVKRLVPKGRTRATSVARATPPPIRGRLRRSGGVVRRAGSPCARSCRSFGTAADF